jgi:hypothetical protein
MLYIFIPISLIFFFQYILIKRDLDYLEIKHGELLKLYKIAIMKNEQISKRMDKNEEKQQFEGTDWHKAWTPESGS